MNHIHGIHSFGAQHINALKRTQDEDAARTAQARTAEKTEAQEHPEEAQAVHHRGRDMHSRESREAKGGSEILRGTIDTRHAAAWIADRESAATSNESAEVPSRAELREAARAARKEFIAETAKAGAEEVVEAVTAKIDTIVASGALTAEQAESVSALRDAFSAKITGLIDQVSADGTSGDLMSGIRALARGIKAAYRDLYGGIEELFSRVPSQIQTPDDTIVPAPDAAPTNGDTTPVEPAADSSTTTTQELMLRYRIDRPGDNDTDVSIYIKVETTGAGAAAAEETPAFDAKSFLADLSQAFKSEFIDMRRDVFTAKHVVNSFGHHGRFGREDSERFMEALGAFMKIFQEKLAELYGQHDVEEPPADEVTVVTPPDSTNGATDDATIDGTTGTGKTEVRIDTAA